MLTLIDEEVAKRTQENRTSLFSKYRNLFFFYHNQSLAHGGRIQIDSN